MSGERTTDLFALERPIASAAEIGDRLGHLQREITALLSGMEPPTFVARQGDHWSPAEHLLHLIRSVGAVAKGMRAPKPILGLLFGRAPEDRDFEQMRALYRSHLGKGARASGRYLPEIDEGAADEAVQARMLSGWARTSASLAGRLGSWSESQLDRYRLPHPVLGKLTVREMLFFTLYHNAHHARRIRERMGDAVGADQRSPKR